MTAPRSTNKERVNISVDPAVHRHFSEFAERNNQTVSGILNDLMIIYSGCQDQFSPSPQILERLRQMLLRSDCTAFQRIVHELARSAGLNPVDVDDSDPNDIRRVPPEQVSEWVGTSARGRTGVRIAFNLAREPDITLGQALLFRGTARCERVVLAVPYRLGISSSVLTATEQAGLEVVGVDSLAEVLRGRARREEPNAEATEGARRVDLAKEELNRMRTKRKARESKTTKQAKA